MPAEKFLYSRWYAWWPYGYNAIWGPMTYHNHVQLLQYHHGQLFESWEMVCFVVLLLFFVWHFFRYLLPMLQKKPYLEIDAEKINFRHKGKIIYASDIKAITVGFFGNSLILKLKNKRKARIYLNCIRGDNGDIAQAVFDFAKNVDGERLGQYII